MPPDAPSTLPPAPDAQRRLAAARERHWQRTRRMTLVLLAVWLATGFGTVFFARELSRFDLFGWPLSFYMAAQGAALISLAIIGVYAWRMRVLDREAAASGSAP